MTDQTNKRAKQPKRQADLKGTRELWTYQDLFAYLKIPKSTVYMYVAMEKIPCVRIGRHTRFIPEEIERFVRKMG